MHPLPPQRFEPSYAYDWRYLVDQLAVCFFKLHRQCSYRPTVTWWHVHVINFAMKIQKTRSVYFVAILVAVNKIKPTSICVET